MAIDPVFDNNTTHMVALSTESLAADVLYSGRSLLRTEIGMQLDPRLQRAIACRELGFSRAATASTGADEIAVIALVTDTAAWQELSEVRIGETIGKDPEGIIVTGRVALSRIEAVRKQPFVKSLKAAQPVMPSLASGVTETGAAPLPAGSMTNGGQGVVIGVIDYGCAFAHRNFLSASGTSRIEALWVQSQNKVPGSSVKYGREYLRADLNAALKHSDPYAALGYDPNAGVRPDRGSHGTHVMDIAGGNGNGSGASGFAPNCDLIFVHIAHEDLQWSGPSVVESKFGDSVQLLEAVRYIFEKAGDRPCVVNLSLGTNGGPHDGTSLVERGIDSLVSAAPNRAVTIAASNSFDDKIHISGTVALGASQDIVWRIPFGDDSHNEVEIWYDGDDRFTLEIIDPAGTSIGQIAPGSNGTVAGPGGQVELHAVNRLSDPNNQDNSINIFLERIAAPGDWILRLHGNSIANGSYHAWIERDNLRSSSFPLTLDNTHTIGSISCGKSSIVVASYDAHKSSTPISWFSSAGPTRDGREKPEIAAPGHGVFAAYSRTTADVTMMQGTSMASPAVAGIIALMFGEARQRGLSLSIGETRDILFHGARRAPPAGGGWDERYGLGRVDANDAVKGVMQWPSASGTAVAAMGAKPAQAPRKPRAVKQTKPTKASGSRQAGKNIA